MGRTQYILLICDDFSRFTSTYFMRQKSDTVALFEQFLADECVIGNPSAVEVVRSDEGGELKGGFEKLCRRHNIRQTFTAADSAKSNGVAGCHIAMVESAGRAAQVQSHFLVDTKFRLVAHCGLNAAIGRAMRSTVREVVLMGGINHRSKCVLLRDNRARSFSLSQGT